MHTPWFNIYPLSNIAPVNAHFDTIDFQSLEHLFPSSTLRYEDINSLLQTISETNMMQEQLSVLFQHTDSSLTSYQPSYAFSTTISAATNVFLQLMSYYQLYT